VNALALFLAMAGAPNAHVADPNPHFDTAVAAWKERRWIDAADAFARAYELDPRSEYVFARAQALRFAGDCPAAVNVYRKFIVLDPPQAAIDEAREHITTCNGEAASPQTSTVTHPPVPRVETPAAVVVTRERSAPNKWWRDPTGHVLGWTGLVATVVGTGFVAEGFARREGGERADDEQSYRDARRGGATLLHAGIPLLSIGGVLVLAAVVRFAVVSVRNKRHRTRRTARVRSGFAPHGSAIAWSP